MLESTDQKELFRNAVRYSSGFGLHHIHDAKHLFEMVTLQDHYNSVYYWSTARTVFYTAKWIYEHPRSGPNRPAGR